MATFNDPWNVHSSAPVPAGETHILVAQDQRGPQPRWWRNAAEVSGLPGHDAPQGRPWWDETAMPAFGNGIDTDPSALLGVAIFKQAIAGGPALHVANFHGNLTVPPKKLVETLVGTMQLRPVRYAYGHEGVKKILFSSKESMLSLGFSDGGRYADIAMASSHEEVFKKVAQLCAGILTHDNPKEGFVYALTHSAMGGYALSRIGAAGTPLERGNYNPQVLANYDHVVADLKAESPCGRLIIMAGEPGTGKCVAKGTLIMDAATGELLPVEKIVERQCRVPSFSKESGITFVTPSAWLRTGVKTCLRLATKAGHSLETTPEHPLLTPDGWKRLDQIQPDDYVAAAACIPFPEEQVRLPDDHVTLLAALLAEGNYTQNHVGFSNEDPEILGAVNQALKCVEGSLHQYPSQKSCDWRVLSAKTEENGRLSRIRQFLDKYGMGHKLAPEKSIPEVVFRLGPEQLAKFLGILWSCDGSIEKRSSDITLGMASKAIVEGVQHLLLRFGIRSNVKSKIAKLKGKQFHSWRLCVTSTTKEQFVKSIPLVGEKAEKAQRIKFYDNPNDDLIPMTPGVRQMVEQAAEKHRAAGGSFEPMRKSLGWDDTCKCSERVLLRRACTSRRMLQAFIETTGAGELSWLTRARWEVVTSVVSVGDREVYDLTVPGTHNFLANDLVAHNTYLVRSLLADIPKAAFVVVPSHMVKELGSPALLPALAGARHGGMDGPMALIIEDADKVLVNREAGDMSAISSLLNLGDGILGSVLDVRIIATTNAKVLEMDAATRRKGRLCAYVDVGPVEPEQAETIVQRLVPGSTKRPAKRVTLAEVYSHARDIGWKPPAKQRTANPWAKDYIL